MMNKDDMSFKNTPNSSNTLYDVVVEIPKVDVITPKTILKTLYRDNADMAMLCIIMSLFLFVPISICIFFYNETFRWHHAILPLILFIGGVGLIYSLISSFVKTRKRKEHILCGNFIVEKSNISGVYSEYNSPAESDDYFIKVENNWIKVPFPIYCVAKRVGICYKLYLFEKGKKVLFLIYIGKCTFDKGIL